MPTKESSKPKLPSMDELMNITEAMANFFQIQGKSIIEISEFQEKYEKEMSEFQGFDPSEMISKIKEKDSKIAEKFVQFYLEYAQLLTLQPNAKTHKDRKELGKRLIELGKILLEIKSEMTNELKKKTEKGG